MVTTILNLPLELICLIIDQLSLHSTAQFSLSSKSSLAIFKFNLGRLMERALTEWFVYIFRCPECDRIFRGGSGITSTILVGTPPQEQNYRTCRGCYYKVRKENMKKMNTILVTYRTDRDQKTKIRHMAFAGINRYQSCCKYPRKKDLVYMQNIVKQIYKVSS